MEMEISGDGNKKYFSANDSQYFNTLKSLREYRSSEKKEPYKAKS